MKLINRKNFVIIRDILSKLRNFQIPTCEEALVITISFLGSSLVKALCLETIFINRSFTFLSFGSLSTGHPAQTC